jgi:hypothetical protein
MVRTEISKCVIEFYFTVSNIVFLRLLCDEFINLPYEQRLKNFHLKYYDYHVRISFLLLILFCAYWLILPSVFFPLQGCWSLYRLFIIHKFECAYPGGSAVEVLCVCDRCLGIAGSNPAEGMNVCMLWMLCVVEGSVTHRSLVQGSPTDCACVIECGQVKH